MFLMSLGHSRVMRVIKYFSIETGFCLQGATLLSVVPLHYTGLEKKIVDSALPFVDKLLGWECLAFGHLLVTCFSLAYLPS
jgi:hypothetical protein